MIWDCFTFFNEVDIVEIRVRELASLPDLKHVLVVADADHRGRPLDPRPALLELKGRLADIGGGERIVVYTVGLLPGFNDAALYPRERESIQRNGITKALHAFGAAEDDVVTVTDADEIPTPGAINWYAGGQDGVHSIDMRHHCYWLDGVVSNTRWTYGRIMRRRNMEWFGGPDHIRLTEKQLPQIPNAGWHYSWCGGVEAVQKKLRSFSHHEADTLDQNDPERIRRAMDGDRQFWDQKRLDFVPIDASFPVCVQETPGKWAHLLRSMSR